MEEMLHAGRVGCLFTAKKLPPFRAFQESLYRSLPRLLRPPPELNPHPPGLSSIQPEKAAETPKERCRRVLLLQPCSCVLTFLRIELKNRAGALGTSALAARKTSQLLMPNKCLLKPRGPRNCTVQNKKLFVAALCRLPPSSFSTCSLKLSLDFLSVSPPSSSSCG